LALRLLVLMMVVELVAQTGVARACLKLVVARAPRKQWAQMILIWR
jgi:hypothetical protein